MMLLMLMMLMMMVKARRIVGKGLWERFPWKLGVSSEGRGRGGR
jgi:hypothetical protein